MPVLSTEIQNPLWQWLNQSQKQIDKVKNAPLGIDSLIHSMQEDGWIIDADLVESPDSYKVVLNVLSGTGSITVSQMREVIRELTLHIDGQPKVQTFDNNPKVFVFAVDYTNCGLPLLIRFNLPFEQVTLVLANLVFVE